MAIEFRYKEANVSYHELKEKTYVNADGTKVVDIDKHKGPASILGGAGHKIPMSQAIALGLAEGEKKEEKDSKEVPEKEKKEKK